MTAEERIAIVPLVEPEPASLSLGSVIGMRDPVAKRYKDEDYKFAWEKKFLLSYRNGLFTSTVGNIELFYNKMPVAEAKPVIEIFGLG